MAINAVYGNIFRRKDPDDLTDFLKTVCIFENLSSGDLKILGKCLHRRTYESQETVFSEGETGVGMYIVLEGKVAISIRTDDGAQKILAHLVSGDFFGEMAVLEEEPRSATATAETPTVLLGFFYPDLLNLIEQKPRLGASILLELSKTVAERLRVMNREYRRLVCEMRCRGLDPDL